MEQSAGTPMFFSSGSMYLGPWEQFVKCFCVVGKRPEIVYPLYTVCPRFSGKTPSKRTSDLPVFTVSADVSDAYNRILPIMVSSWTATICSTDFSSLIVSAMLSWLRTQRGEAQY
jgi:hypothetical protein